jgi:transcriptional regulator with XRE-family HTH domain
MLIGTRLCQLRKQKGMSQRDIEECTGFGRYYVSRVEHGHTVPSLETVERFAGVLGVPFYQLFYAGDEAPQTPSVTHGKTLEELTGDKHEKGPDAQFLLKLRNLLSRLAEPDRDAILRLAERLAAR